MACALNARSLDFSPLRAADRVGIRTRDDAPLKTLTHRRQIRAALDFAERYSSGWGDPIAGPRVPAFMLYFYRDRAGLEAYGVGADYLVSNPHIIAFSGAPCPPSRSASCWAFSVCRCSRESARTSPCIWREWRALSARVIAGVAPTSSSARTEWVTSKRRRPRPRGWRAQEITGHLFEDRGENAAHIARKRHANTPEWSLRVPESDPVGSLVRTWLRGQPAQRRVAETAMLQTGHEHHARFRHPLERPDADCRGEAPRGA